MLVTTLRSRLRRILTVLSVSLVAAGTTVALSATPAHASLVYQGTFLIKDSFGLCVGPQNNGRARQTPIVLQNCDGSSGQRWAIFLATDQNNYWIQAHGGEFPLNMCMDANQALVKTMWLWNCNGGNNQRYYPNQIGGSNPNTIMSVFPGDNRGEGTRSCVNSLNVIPGSALKVEGCGKFPFITGTSWLLVAA